MIAREWDGPPRGSKIATAGADLGSLLSGLADMDGRVRDLVARINAG